MRPLSSAFWRIRPISRPAPSSASSNTTSLLSWRREKRTSPIGGLPLWLRCSGVSRPCAIALRSKCSNGAVIFSSTLRSSSISVPDNSRLARLPSSLPVWRTMRYRRSLMLANGTMRMLISPCCRSRLRCACAFSAAAVSSRFFSSVCCTVCTSCTLSVMKRVSSWKRVKRSNSSGSNWPATSVLTATLACIWLSAWISISRNCLRKRLTLSVSSSTLARNSRSSASTRERVTLTSPASLTSRSTISERTRSRADCIARSAPTSSAATTAAGATGASVAEASATVSSACCAGASSAAGRVNCSIACAMRSR